MDVAVFSAKDYDREFLSSAVKNRPGISWAFIEPRLTGETVPLADGYEAVCLFVHDAADAELVKRLADGGTRLIALRCAGFNHIDLSACAEHGIGVMRVPAYSPHAVAEHAVGMILELNRKFYRAHNRIRESNFSLDGLAGFDVHGKTVGVVGTGTIGACFARIMLGFGCRVLGYDVRKCEELERAGVDYVELDALLENADIVSLHCPLVDATHHLINSEVIRRMKRGVMLINTSRGPLIDTDAVIDGIKSGQIGYLGLDVYEEEEGVFFEDHSSRIITDDRLMRLVTFPNVLITSHQAFFTREALENIAETTAANIEAWMEGRESGNEVCPR